MLKKLLKNPGIKIFCLVVAAVLWLYVAAGQHTIGKYPGSIKIKAMNIPSGYEAIYDLREVNIKIMADPSVWNKLSVDSFSAYIDLSGHSEGTYELPVEVTSSVPGVSIVQKDPDQILVRLEQVVTKEIEIKSKVEGSAGEGLIAGTIEFNPTKTTVRGPKSVVNGISEAIAIVRLNGETANFEKTISLIAYDENGDEVQNLTFTPAETIASTSIVKASNNKTVGVKVITVGAPKTGFYVSNITVTPSTVDIIGQTNILSATTFIETLAIDINALDNTVDKEVALNPKTGISLQAGVSSKVRVKIYFARAEVTREMTATINPINIPGSYKVTGYSTNQVKVTCYGPNDLISGLKSSDIVLTLDFSGKNVSGSNPSINFDLTASNFNAPLGISIGTFLPSSITTALSN